MDIIFLLSRLFKWLTVIKKYLTNFIKTIEKIVFMWYNYNDKKCYKEMKFWRPKITTQEENKK